MTKCIDLYIAAARSSTHKAGGFAAISVQENGEKTEYSGGRGTVSIYRLQLEALWSSLKEEKGAAKIRLHTDDAFIIKMIRHHWLSRWEEQNWKGRQNADLLRCIYLYEDRLSVAQDMDERIAGHCKELAAAAAAQYYAYRYKLIPSK